MKFQVNCCKIGKKYGMLNVLEARVKLTQDEVIHIAKLARIKITDQENQKYSEQLSEILNYVGQLEEIDTDSIPPTARVNEGVNVLRDDVVIESIIPKEELLKNAPDQFDGYVKVKAVLE